MQDFHQYDGPEKYFIAFLVFQMSASIKEHSVPSLISTEKFRTWGQTIRPRKNCSFQKQVRGPVDEPQA